MRGAEVAQQGDLLGAANNVHKADAVRLADPHKHLPEVRGRGRVNDRLVPLGSHGLDEAERGQRVDEQRGAVLSRGAVGQNQAIPGRDQAAGAHTWRRRTSRPACRSDVARPAPPR